MSRISSARGAPGIAQIQKRADFVQGEAQVAGLLDESERSPTNLIQDDTALAKRVARNFDHQFEMAGMAGMKVSVGACYARARETLKESAIEYCYLLDQLACSIDAAAAQHLKMPQDNYWECATALARTIAAITIIQPDPQARLLPQRWARAKAISFDELESLATDHGGPSK